MKYKISKIQLKLEEESVGKSVSFPSFFNTIKLVFLGSILSGCSTSNQFGFMQHDPYSYYENPLNTTVTQPTEYGNQKFVGGGSFTRKIPAGNEDQDFRISGNTIYHADGSTSRINGNTFRNGTTTFHSDGSSSRRSGNTIYHSDGSTSRINGNTIHHSDGTSAKINGEPF